MPRKSKRMHDYTVTYLDANGRVWRTVIDATTGKAAGNKIRRGGKGRKIRKVKLIRETASHRTARIQRRR